MWKAQAGVNVNVQPTNDDDDWETDPNFVNDVTEEEQRWGSKTVEGSGRTAAALNMNKLREQVTKDDDLLKKKMLEEGPQSSYGYGGKFGVQQDRMDKSALGHDHLEKLEKHASQKDYASGFGGKYGVQTDRVDKNAVGWDYKHKPEKHESQKDYATGFGGKYGVQKDRQDKSAVGWEYHEKLSKHESQTDYAQGFGGKYGVQTDRQDKSAKGWDEKTAKAAHPSQTDMKIGFGGKFGVQTDRVDQSAFGYTDNTVKTQSTSRETIDVKKPEPGKINAIRARFENASSTQETKPMPATSNGHKVMKPARKMIPPCPSVQETVQEKNDQSIETPPSIPTPERIKEDVNQNEEEEDTAQDWNEPEEVPQYNPISQVEQKIETEHVEEPANVPAQQQFTQNTETLDDAQDHSYYDNVPENGGDALVESSLSAVALYDYEAAADDELTFDPGEVITNVEMIDEGWWRGECRGKIGLFPANYVELQ